MKECYNCKSEISEKFKFCPNCGSNQVELVCPKCTYSNEPNSKFCQECGFMLAAKQQRNKADKVEMPTKPIPSFGITVEFNFSTSQSFEFAVEEAQKFHSFEQLGEDKKAIYRVTVPESEIESLDPLIENLKGWRNRKVYHNGQKVPWDNIFDYKWCYDQRKSSYKPHLYCFGYENDYEYNLWGCIQTRLSFNAHSDIFTFGEWLNTDGDWAFDKERIRHVLEKRIYPYRFCPAINLELIQDVLLAFPEKVNPAKDKNWKFVQNYSSQDGLKITERTSYGEIEEFYANGAAPIKMKTFLEEITKKMTLKLPKEIK